jgi:hypothetical protein
LDKENKIIPERLCGYWSAGCLRKVIDTGNASNAVKKDDIPVDVEGDAQKCQPEK